MTGRSGAAIATAVPMGPLLRRLRADNPSPMTHTGTNTYLLGTGQVAVIDPGPADERHLAGLLAALAPDERITAILVTHAHLDHAGLAPRLAEVSGAPVFGFAGSHGAVPAGARPGDGTDGDFRPTVPLADGAIVDGAGWSLRAIHTPGHRHDHLSFAWDDQCFTGDHVMGWSTSIVSPPEGNMGAYMSSLARLEGGGWRRFLPGHGEPVEDPAARLAELTAHRRAREAQILAELAAAPASAGTLTGRLYAATDPRLMPAAERNVLAHLEHLVDRNRVLTATGTGGETLYRLP
jgi:hydroxyacylglutathione hydrolase